MDTNTLLKQFKDECEVVEFKYEYPGYVGYEQYGIITALSEKELTDKYAEILKEFSPYIVLDLSYGETRNEFRKNEDKHRKRSLRSVDAFNYEDGEIECFHSELIGESVEDIVLHGLASEVLYAALNMLTEKQKERIIKYYLQGLTLEKIAEDEGVYYKAISFSIESGLKKLKKLLENDY